MAKCSIEDVFARPNTFDPSFGHDVLQSFIANSQKCSIQSIVEHYSNFKSGSGIFE